MLLTPLCQLGFAIGEILAEPQEVLWLQRTQKSSQHLEELGDAIIMNIVVL